MRTMIVLRTIAAAALAASLAACSTWPAEVGGGVAEMAPPAARPDPGYAALERHLDCSLHRTAAIAEAAAAAGQNTGRAALLESMAARAQREFAGRLPNDANRTLSQLDREADLLGVVLHVDPQTSDSGHCTA